MNEEKMKILQMVEEQKISVEDALKLLDAVKGRHEHGYSHYVRFEGADVEAKVSKLANHIDNFAREFGGKMETTFKDMEPKLRKATKVVVEKTASVINDISEALNESLKNLEEKGCSCDEPKDNECCCDDKDDENKEN